MSYQSKVATYNTKVRIALFFLRPFHVFGVFLLLDLWNKLSYGPSTFPGYWGKEKAAAVTIYLWHDVFSQYVWYFILAVIADIAIQEFLPLINKD
jgi:hypothetical protein